jgi:hypothetical protein
LSGREAGRGPSDSHSTTDSVETLEVAPGAAREKLEGRIPALTNAEELCAALEQAFDYRGDVQITRKDGTKIEGYIFDRRRGRNLAESCVRLLPKNGGPKTPILYSDIAALVFTGRDMAAGKSWDNWVKQYWEKKAAGEKNISLAPEKLE